MKSSLNHYPLWLSLLILAVFGRVITFDLVNYDDPFYVHNIYVVQGLTLEGLRFAFAFGDSHYGPLVWLSYMFDVEIFGGNPAGFHLINLTLHLINTLLFYHVIAKMTKDPKTGFFAAVLFAIHPLRVETVAWVADRKDLLAMLFSLGALEGYRRYVTSRKIRDYVLTAVLFILGLLSKPVLVTLPFTLLLLDLWPLRRIDLHGDSLKSEFRVFVRLFVEKLSLIFISIGFVAWTYHSLAQANQLISEDAVPMLVRWANAPVTYVRYLIHVFWPSGLTVLYPQEYAQAPGWQVAGSSVLLLVLSLMACLQIRKRPYLFVGWFWFVGNLVPMIGIFRVGPEEMADRYTYFPLVGLILLVAWGMRQWAQGRRTPTWVPAAASALIVIILAGLSVRQLAVWENSLTLFQHTVRYLPNHVLVQTNLGYSLMERGDLEGGIVHFKKAVQIAPNHFMSWMNLGTSYRKLGRIREAVAAYLECLRIEPENVVAHYYLGQLFHQLGDGPRAVQHTRRALTLLQARYGPDFDKTRKARSHLQEYEEIYQLPSAASPLPG